MRRINPSELITSLLSEEGREDPYPIYADLREYGAVVTVQARVPGGHLVERRQRPAARSEARRRGRFFALLSGSILNTNPPDHTRVRKLMSGASRQAGRRADLGDRSQAHALIEEITQKGAPADLIADFAYRLPLGVICELLGVPEKDRSWFRPVAADFAVALEGNFTMDEAAAAQSAAELFEAYFSDLVRSRRGTRKRDLIYSWRPPADGLYHPELLGKPCAAAGRRVRDHHQPHRQRPEDPLGRPVQLARLACAPDPDFVEEFLRFDAPVQLTSRMALEDTVCGQPVPTGTILVRSIGSANRDPKRFPDPDRFDPSRPGNTPISFGAGAHFCLGAALARLEAQVAFPPPAATASGLALAGEPTRRHRWCFAATSPAADPADGHRSP